MTHVNSTGSEEPMWVIFNNLIFGEKTSKNNKFCENQTLGIELMIGSYCNLHGRYRMR